MQGKGLKEEFVIIVFDRELKYHYYDIILSIE